MLFKKKKKKFMVIGLDGVPVELIKAYTEQGVMPNMKRLADKYALLRTQVPVPEVSSVSWTSFMTGMNPGQHGIYGFMEIDRNNYSYTFPSFRTLPVKAMWEELGDQGKRSVILNLPNTFPARPMDGVLVSGFVALDLPRAVYPKSQLSYLESIDYQVDVDTSAGKNDKKFFMREIHDTLQMRMDLFKKYNKEEKWDLFFLIVTGTDRLHHFLFNASDDPSVDFHDQFKAYYSAVDQMIGEVTGEMESKGIPFIILSDHGFVKIKQEVYISQYLQEWGYLSFEEVQPKNLKSITPDSRVFALDPSRLYFHLEGKYSRGTVKKDQCKQLAEEIKQRFMELEINGEKVIKNIFHKEEIYHGKYLENAPDLVLLSNYGYDLKSGVTKRSHFGKTFFEGMHSQDNAMLLDSHGFQLDEHPFIYDIGQKVKEYF